MNVLGFCVVVILFLFFRPAFTFVSHIHFPISSHVHAPLALKIPFVPFDPVPNTLSITINK